MSISNKNALYLNGAIWSAYGLFGLLAPKLFTDFYFKSDLPINEEAHVAWNWYGQQCLTVGLLNFAAAKSDTKEMKVMQKGVFMSITIGTAIGIGLCVKYKEKSEPGPWYQALSIITGLCAMNGYLAFR